MGPSSDGPRFSLYAPDLGDGSWPAVSRALLQLWLTRWKLPGSLAARQAEMKRLSGSLAISPFETKPLPAGEAGQTGSPGGHTLLLCPATPSKVPNRAISNALLMKASGTVAQVLASLRPLR